MAARCAVCEGKRSNPVHLRAVAGAAFHAYQDASKAGLKPVSEGRAEYLASQTHKDAYGAQNGAVCVFEAAGAPEACYGPMTKHHLFPRARAGSLERAERVAPVADACSRHNTWSSQAGIEWAESHYVTIGGRDWHLLLSDAEARELERTGREYRPASVPSQAVDSASSPIKASSITRGTGSEPSR